MAKINMKNAFERVKNKIDVLRIEKVHERR
jgi:hypothetical protein